MKFWIFFAMFLSFSEFANADAPQNTISGGVCGDIQQARAMTYKVCLRNVTDVPAQKYLFVEFRAPRQLVARILVPVLQVLAAPAVGGPTTYEAAGPQYVYDDPHLTAVHRGNARYHLTISSQNGQQMATLSYNAEVLSRLPFAIFPER